MKQKIYLVTFTSYTNNDDYIHNDVEVHVDEEEARKSFDHWKDYAREECEWGSAFDLTPEEREENEDEPYSIDECCDDGLYIVSSAAYDGYKVEVKMVEKEIDIPLPSNCLPLKKGIGDMMHWMGDDGKARTTKVTGVQAYRYSNPREVEENSCYQTYVVHKGTRQVAWVDESDIIR